MSLTVLKKAIQERKSISFEYNKEGKVPGQRIGNPHAVFILRRLDETESTKVHIVQTEGVTDSVPNFPEFRTFDISELSGVEIIESKTPFPINDKYKPESDMYRYVIAKV
jgi:hypothetical protein